TTHKRIRSETIRAVNRVIAFAGGEQSGNVGALVEVDPQPAHRIMHAGEDAHRHVTRIVADEHLVNLENRAEFAIQNVGGNVRHVEINLVLATDAHAFNAHLE